MNVDDAARAILVAHQRRDIRSCICGWAELGRIHAGHQVAVLREAGLLATGPVDDARVTAMLREAGLISAPE